MAINQRKILYVLENYWPHVGGVETLFQATAEALAERGCEVNIVTSRRANTSKFEVLNGVRIHRVDVPVFERYTFTLTSLPLAIKLASSSDLIHTTTYNAAMPGWIAGYVTNKPTVITVHEVFGPQWHDLPGMSKASGFLHRVFESAILHLPFQCYICVSEFTKGRLQKYVHTRKERAAVLYNGVDYSFWNPDLHHARDLRKELGLPSNAFLYLYFGRPGISKGVEYLIRAASKVKRTIEPSYLVLLLSRSPAKGYENAKSLVAELSLGDHVRFCESVQREELPSYLLAADCVVVPSISEGFGFAAVEAASIGCKVVTTRGHAVEEILGESAIYANPRDSDDLGNVIVKVAGDRGKGLAAPKNYLIQNHVDATLALYESLGQHGWVD